MTTARWRIVLPVLVLLAAVVCTWLLAAGSAPVSAERVEPAPIVKVVRVQARRLRVPVRSQGVLRPVREIDLTAEVQGRVEALHDSFVVGGRFKSGEVLVKVAPHEYQLAVVRAETQLAEAKRKLAEEQAAEQQAQREWKVLGQGAPTPLSLHEPQVQEARARLKQAEAELAAAKRHLSRCEIRAPFGGRVKEKLTGVGQMAEIGKVLGRIYADDAAEVRLPLSQAQIGYLPELRVSKANRPKVALTAERGAETVRREAVIVRREGIVDQATGMEYWVARLDDPERTPALLPGTFLTAEIEGRELDGVFELPRGALNAAQEAVLVDADGKLEIRRLQVLRGDADRVWVGGLQAGERVVVSGIETPVSGQRVVAEADDDLL
ncbi:efflux RND transporter periplasmic adaptor subunit [Methylomonas sp. MgM2]